MVASSYAKLGAMGAAAVALAGAVTMTAANLAGSLTRSSDHTRRLQQACAGLDPGDKALKQKVAIEAANFHELQDQVSALIHREVRFMVDHGEDESAWNASERQRFRDMVLRQQALAQSEQRSSDAVESMNICLKAQELFGTSRRVVSNDAEAAQRRGILRR
ncbi:MAG: hypothetical protein KGJ86_07060 [Chloroflexota bacterium]|nr:hypothetical protein [Chloroflexota bacterium]